MDPSGRRARFDSPSAVDRPRTTVLFARARTGHQKATLDQPGGETMRLSRVLVVALTVVAAQFAYAQAPKHGAPPSGTSAASAKGEGEVRKVDKQNAKITLKHGELKNLQMPPMTMVFDVKDKSMLDNVKAGDKVRFTVDNVGGQLTVTSIEAVR
jgi:Cu/Ag efflux protein CusF